LDDRSPVLVGWDGSEFGVVVTWTEGYGDWGETALTDVFRFDEEGLALGSFPVDRPAFDAYTGDQLHGIFETSDRLVLMSDADYYVLDEAGEPDVEWGGLHLAPIDLATGEPAGEDARLWNGWRVAPMARSGNRLGILWVDREYTDEARTEWIEHLMFTVLDCPGVFGEPAT
jgi:hypothetical protein